MQNTERLLDTRHAADAQLIVCTAAATAGYGALQRLRNWCRLPRSAQPQSKPTLRLQVDDLHGQRVATVDDAGPQLVLDLPAGTYQVTAIMGEICRGYTLTLQPGDAFNLQLCHAFRCK
jgi:hypothetical protein